MSLDVALKEADRRADELHARFRTKAAGGSPMAAVSSVASYGGRQMMNAREQLEHLTSWVYAAVRPIAQRVCRQPVNVGRRVRGPASRTRKGAVRGPGWAKAAGEKLSPLPSHPLLAALRNPNPLMLQWELTYVTVCHLELSGVAYWWVDDGEDGVPQVWPLPPSWVTPENDPETPTPFDRYRVTPWGSAPQIIVPRDRILRFAYPHPADPYQRTLSPLQATARAVNADEAMEVAQYRSFQNGIFPGVALMVGKTASPDGTQSGVRPVLQKEQREQLITAIKQRYAGAYQAGEPLILDGLIEDVKRISNTPEELDFLSSTSTLKGRIMQVIGTNPIIAGEIEGANRASAVIASEHFNEFTVNPPIELLSQGMTRWFASYFRDPDLVAWIEEARARDAEQERADREQLLKAGAIKLNELREACGYEPVDGGDELIEPVAAGQAQEGGRAAGPATFPG